MHQIMLKGLASGKVWRFNVDDDQVDADLLTFLREKTIPVASSCSGEGVCKKCVFNESFLSCKELVGDWVGKEIVFAYL